MIKRPVTLIFKLPSHIAIKVYKWLPSTSVLIVSCNNNKFAKYHSPMDNILSNNRLCFVFACSLMFSTVFPPLPEVLSWRACFIYSVGFEPWLHWLSSPFLVTILFHLIFVQTSERSCCQNPWKYIFFWHLDLLFMPPSLTSSLNTKLIILSPIFLKQHLHPSLYW